ncbi:hypothetical protein K1T71_013783 [Dendrolimus kikuchii]|uniref:Uncharacterized protein n=1 Tax=Dendrolimus kikuchii TaxID=765133 RepID=A0ACC1CFZ7_9NEOP|nr:hypothetical protein K1T71_013783 [Dendrolimus kikuchii]
MSQPSRPHPSSRPTQPGKASSAKSLRKEVLTRSSIAVSAAGSATSEESCTQKGPTVEVLQKVREWSADELPPRKITSEDEDSDASTEGECAGRGRPSMIPFISTRRKGVEMDVATKLANDMLLKAKEALEKSGNLKTEIKLTVIDSLQTLYDTCLALSDSRSRHKYNLERERTRHAQELVRAERAHTESVSKLTASLTKELQSARSDIKANLESTEAVRRWLGYETQEPYAKISALLATSQAMEKRLNTLHTSLADIPRTTEGKRSNKELEKLQTGVDNLSRQLDSLRREITTIKTSTESTAEDTKKALSTLVSSEDKATAAAALKETQATTKSQKILQESINDLATQVRQIKTAHANTPPPPPIELGEHLQPITESLEAVKSDIRTLKENLQHQQQAPPATSLAEELSSSGQSKVASYAEVAAKKKPVLKPNHTLIISSPDPLKTGEKVIEEIRLALDPRKTGAKVDRIRTGKNQKVILSCGTKEDLKLVEDRVKNHSKLKAEIAKTSLPLVIVKDVMAYHTDKEIEEQLAVQNAHLLKILSPKAIHIRVRSRKKTRNPLQCHVILEVSAPVHKRFTEEGHLYIGIQRRPVEDQSPLVQCAKCLGYGHTRAHCQEAQSFCSHCGGKHTWEECNRRKDGVKPACRNCKMAGDKNPDTLPQHAHNAYSPDCPERHKWDAIARTKINYSC